MTYTHTCHSLCKNFWISSLGTHRRMHWVLFGSLVSKEFKRIQSGKCDPLHLNHRNSNF